VMGGVILTVQYLVLLPLFALAAKRAAAREPLGWRARGGAAASLESPY